MTLDVELAGAGGPLVVAVHGIQGTRGAWQPVVRGVPAGGDAPAFAGLASDHRLVLPNLRGRGAAPRGHGAADHCLDMYAADLAAAVRPHADDSTPFVLAGWSLGVSIALHYLQRGDAPQPAGVVLVSGTPWLAGTAWFDGHGAALLASVAARRLRLGLQDHADDSAAAWTWEAIRQTDQRPQLPGIALPALVIHGRDDDDCPLTHGRMLADGLRAPLLVLDGVGHGVLAQAGATVAAQMRAFTRRVLAPAC